MRFGSSRLERLFSTHHQSLYVSALSITRDRAAAEDAVHDALLAVSSVETAPNDLKAYLFKAVRNRALLYVKQLGKFAEWNSENDLVDSNSFDNEKSLFVHQVLGKVESLDRDSQQVILLKLFSDMTFREIGEILGSPENTVASWYRRGLAKLQEKLNEDQ